MIQNILNTVTRAGFGVEQMLNNSIQETLNHQFFFKSVADQTVIAANAVQKLQNRVEALSIPFNFPTKKDVANTSQLVLLTEQKIDRLEDKIIELTRTIETLREQQTEKADAINGPAAEQ